MYRCDAYERCKPNEPQAKETSYFFFELEKQQHAEYKK